ncbi:hypothetical protein DL770_009154 [Monosporascus sp. CRB-9-2]|nr:hypothetical protein DL770_009154 [Monosporascus sp. CRB-9-2]
MAPPAHNPFALLSALLSVIEHRIVPLTAQPDLAAVTVATNDERASLLHGEINCIQRFFESSSSSGTSRPVAPADYMLLARRPLYNRRNKFFTACSFAELVADIEDSGSGRDGRAGSRG